MTNEAAKPPMAPAPPLGYWYSQLNHADQAKASKEGSLRVAKEFKQAILTGVETYTKPVTDPEKLREGYRSKPVALWVGQRIYFPDMFEAAWRKWERVDDTREGRQIRSAVMAEVVAQAEAFEQQLAMQEAQARQPPQPSPTGPVGAGLEQEAATVPPAPATPPAPVMP